MSFRKLRLLQFALLPLNLIEKLLPPMLNYNKSAKHFVHFTENTHNKGNQHIQSKNIPHDTFAFDCDCGNAIDVFIPKKIHAVGMNYNTHCDLINGRFDHIFTSLYSVPSIEQPGYGEYVHASVAK